MTGAEMDLDGEERQYVEHFTADIEYTLLKCKKGLLWILI
jgi:hypothetical protein